MRQSAKANNIIGLALVVITCCLVLSWLNLVPTVAANRLKVRDGKESVKQAQDKLDSFNEVNSKITQIKDTIEKVAIAIPEDSNYQSVLVSLEAIGVKEGLPIYSFQPSLRPASSSEAVFPQITFSFSLLGDYAHLTNFVKDLETNLRIMKINAISISQVDGSQSQLSVTVSTFYRSNSSGGQ